MTKVSVTSQSDPDKSYEVTLYTTGAHCTCAHHTFRGVDCKHIKAVRALKYHELEMKAGSVDDETLGKLIAKYSQTPGPVLLALLAEQQDRQQLPVEVKAEPVPVFRSGLNEEQRRALFA